MNIDSSDNRIEPATSAGDRFTETSVELLRGGKSVRFRAPGWSMHPTIRDGEAITVQPVQPAAVKRGDIVLYRCDRGVVAHRVVRIEKRAGDNPLYVLRGDGPGAVDEPVEPAQVLGRVVSVERAGVRIDPDTWHMYLSRKVRFFGSRLKKFSQRLLPS
jgi:hypothetical protein